MRTEEKVSSGLFGALLLMASVTTGRGEPARPVPMEDFFRNPEKAAFQISPNGEHISFLMPWQSRLNVHVQKIGADTATRVTSSTERDIVGYAWASNSRLIYVQDTGGDENYRAYAVNVDGSNPKDLTPFPNVQARIIDELENDDDYILIGLNQRNPQLHDVYRVNVHTGEMAMIAENPGTVAAWMTDNAGRLRVATTADGVSTGLLYRKTEADTFRVVVTMSFKEELTPLFFDFDDARLYVVSNLGRDKSAVFEYDPETAKLGKMLFEHEDVDVKGLLRSKKRKVITGATYVTDRLRYHFFDEERRRLHEKLESELPKGYEIAVADQSKDEGKMLVVTYGDRAPGTYYFHDASTGELRKLAEVAPWIDEANMAEMKPIEYRARDGVTIHGYLTVPKGVEAKNLPVVVNPHGGPWFRDSWGFNPEVQFLANRGYAVLQMNFRGSIGYGRAFWERSFKQWGRAMQDDITDGVQWLIKEGIADPARVGIYGGSYGGYATLAGLTFTPDLYACGVDYVGVSNLFTFLASFPPYWEPFKKMVYEMVGDPEADKEALTAASPFFHADKIKAPLLVAQGANDPRVKKAESDQIVEALRKRGIDVPYIVKDNEGHGFMNEENRFDFYRQMETFLAKHLAGRS